MNRPSWRDWFMGFAEHAALRSHDPSTKHGAVVVNARRRIIGVGYNGFPAGGPDDQLPLERPDKYAFMVYAEINALLNCTLMPETGAVLYVTGLPCAECMKAIIQVGIRRVVYGGRDSSCVDRDVTETLAGMYGVELEALNRERAGAAG